MKLKCVLSLLCVGLLFGCKNANETAKEEMLSKIGLDFRNAVGYTPTLERLLATSWEGKTHDGKVIELSKYFSKHWQDGSYRVTFHTEGISTNETVNIHCEGTSGSPVFDVRDDSFHLIGTGGLLNTNQMKINFPFPTGVVNFHRLEVIHSYRLIFPSE